MTSEFKLQGLLSNNFLAFLTLLGLLRSLETSRPDWRPSVKWMGQIPYLRVTEAVNKDEVVRQIIIGLMKFGDRIQFDEDSIPKDLESFKNLQNAMDSEITVALGSDGAFKKNGKSEIAPTPLCMMFGGGQQYFLKRLKIAIPDQDNDDVRKEIKEALFTYWEYKKYEEKISFRWDPKEYRQHAYRARDPSKDPILTVNGANRLAAIGFITYHCVPTSNGLNTISYEKKDGEEKIMWPIWNVWLSLSAIQILMRSTYMKKIRNVQNDKDKEQLLQYGVERVMEATMFYDGKLRNISNAKQTI